MIERQQSIDHKASRQEWVRLLQWVEEATDLVMDSSPRNPWLKPVPKEDQEGQLQPSTGFYADIRNEDVGEG